MRYLDSAELEKLKAMSLKIETAEKAILELKELGEGVPVVEKNVRCLLSVTHALKFGISDLAELELD
jgi:hypothetical protein